MNITLKPEQEKFIQTQIESGKFANAQQVIDAAFQLLEKFNDDYLKWIEETRQKVDVSIAELDKGEGLDGETVVQEILKKYFQAKKRRQSGRAKGLIVMSPDFDQLLPDFDEYMG